MHHTTACTVLWTMHLDTTDQDFGGPGGVSCASCMPLVVQFILHGGISLWSGSCDRVLSMTGRHAMTALKSLVAFQA